MVPQEGYAFLPMTESNKRVFTLSVEGTSNPETKARRVEKAMALMCEGRVRSFCSAVPPPRRGISPGYASREYKRGREAGSVADRAHLLHWGVPGGEWTPGDASHSVQ